MHFSIKMNNYPYGKAVFVRISDEYAANIMQKCIVHSNCLIYIHFLVRIPSEQSWSDKRMFAACHIIAAYLQQKLKLFSSTRYYSSGIRNKNLVLDTVRCIFVTVTLTFYVFAECSSKELQLI